jgi:hypothetical protein
VPDRMDDQRGQHGFGQRRKQGREEEHGDNRRDPGDQIRHLAAGARAFLDGRGRHAARGEHAAEQRAHQVGRRVGVQLLIRVHLVAVLFGKLVGHAQRLTIGHQQHAHGRQHHGQIGRERHLREGQRGQPLRQRADDLHAVVAV